MKLRNIRYLPIPLILFISACIKVSSTDVDIILSKMDEALIQKWDARQSAGFWEAMQHFDFDEVKQLPDSSEYKQFAFALHNMLNGNYEKAIAPLEELVEFSADSLIIKHSGTLLSGIYMLSYDWPALIKLDARLPGGIDELKTIDMVKAWQGQKAEEIDYPEDPLKLKMDKSISGVPMIQVLVNGVEQTFWIDTGAEFTVLSSDIAKKCGVEPLSTNASQVGTSTDKKVELWPGVIDELKINDLVIKNHPVFIIGKDDLEFRLFKIIRILKIDGILGWNAIQNLRLELNSFDKTVIIEEPIKNDMGSKNFHFLTQPFVTVSDTNGLPLQFFLDTGANKTAFYAPAFSYFDTSNAKTSKAIVGGAGGGQMVKQLEFSDQSLILGKTRIDFPTIHGASAMGDTEEGFIQYDGILGSDIYARGILILDFQNGYCELVPTNK